MCAGGLLRDRMAVIALSIMTWLVSVDLVKPCPFMVFFARGTLIGWFFSDAKNLGKKCRRLCAGCFPLNCPCTPLGKYPKCLPVVRKRGGQKKLLENSAFIRIA